MEHCLSALMMMLVMWPSPRLPDVTSLKLKPLNCPLNLVFKPRINSNFLEFKSNSSPNLILNFSSKYLAI
jgi:hypothetical protein